MKIILQKSVEQAREPRGYRRGRRRLRAQLPDPQGLRRQGREGCAQARRVARALAQAPPGQAEGRVRGACQQAHRRGAAADRGPRGRGRQALRLRHVRRHRRCDLGSTRDHRRQTRRAARRADPLGGHPRGEGQALPRGRADPHGGGHGTGLIRLSGGRRGSGTARRLRRRAVPSPCRPALLRVRPVLHTCPHGYPHGGNAGQGRSDNKLRIPTCGAAIHTRSPLSARPRGA